MIISQIKLFKNLKWISPHILVLLLCILPHITPLESNFSEADRESTSKLLSRRRRYVNFPEGATFSIAFCLTVGVLGNPMPGIYTFGLNWGMSFNLPNETMSLNTIKRKVIPRPLVARRFRRDLYSKLELIINDMGFSGRDCILRSLCEAAQRLMPKGNTIIEELFRTLFSLPLSRVLPSEPPEHHIYDGAHRAGLENDGESCHMKYKQCPVSLLDMALGYHSPSFQNKLSRMLF